MVDFEFRQYIYAISLLSLLGKRRYPLFEQALVLLSMDMYAKISLHRPFGSREKTF